MRLEQQVAVITGSTKGLGREMAVRFAAEGCRVVVHGTDAARAEEVRRECGPGATTFLGNIGDQPTAVALMNFAIEKFGRLDILVNNAGIVKMEPFLEFEAATWQKLVDIHLSGAFYCGQAAARLMANAGGGRILNISTIAASFGQFGFAAYAPVKAGVEALTRVMAVELAQHKISVNCIAPGPVWNDMMEHLYGPEKLAERCRTIPMQRMAEASEVAELALYLLSPAAGYMTGQVLHLDGGASAAGCFTMEVYKRATS
ncbi:SDR family oxidoreductase [uncultured Paludibaculum sp.]|uniref:SDR family NAD(P)-dependent oxidoreductase n=1 Tax=uncultured Paludibaculum sp. TaxID=1765020 RepID=UPI002AABB575|nr:SDR family oxidoreductase [uncultured Paludibaculum sp.]